jgi:hypothetical protein
MARIIGTQYTQCYMEKCVSEFCATFSITTDSTFKITEHYNNRQTSSSSGRWELVNDTLIFNSDIRPYTIEYVGDKHQSDSIHISFTSGGEPANYAIVTIRDNLYQTNLDGELVIEKTELSGLSISFTNNYSRFISLSLDEQNNSNIRIDLTPGYTSRYYFNNENWFTDKEMKKFYQIYTRQNGEEVEFNSFRQN